MWEKLLSDRRYNGERFFERVKSKEKANSPVRDYVKVYQEDIERIIYSSAFRRLQNKTQVHPFPRSDYFRNRLTHSLEVAQIGRLISGAIAHHLVDSKKLPSTIYASDLVDVVYAACLAHDIGNPPFGHSGEEAIQSWFEVNKQKDLFKGVLDNEQYKYDFLHFDGNAQGFRILCRTQDWRQKGGMRLSAAVMGTFSKYPYSSQAGIEINKKTGKKKFGFFKEDEAIAEAIFQELGLPKLGDGQFVRHPLAYVVEAADDIAYHATDMEDGFRHNLIEYSHAEELLRNAAVPAHMPNLSNISKDRPDDRISYLRSAVVSSLADDCYETFLQHEAQILGGTFRGTLLERGKFKDAILAIEQVCKEKLYVNRPKLEMEAGGFHVLNFLLDEFSTMLEAFQKKEAMSKRCENLFNLFPKEAREHIDHDPYQISCALVDYISGMTDKFAVDLYRKLSGIGLLTQT